PRERAETLAAVSSGLASLSTGAAHHLQTGAANQVIVEMEGGFLFITAISEGSALAVGSGPEAAIGLAGDGMSVLAARIGQVLAPALRDEVSATASLCPPGGRADRSPPRRSAARPGQGQVDDERSHDAVGPRGPRAG